jgi:NAD(P)-dependent dehydrogenase (short-subunit alcohol dehydrogenase family)
MGTVARTVVITGVSRGLGRAMAERFIAEGHRVFGCARSADSIVELKQRFGDPHQFETVEVTDRRQVEAWSGRVLEAAGPPDLLLNNAAIINANAPLWEVPPKEFGHVIDVNIKGVYLVLRGFLPAMVARRRGVIVNFSSGWGRSTSSEVAPYCATKWAIEGLTQALAAELPDGMAAVPLNPGIIHTDMLASCFGEMASSYPTPEAWAKTAVPFLLRLGPRDNGRPLTAP